MDISGVQFPIFVSSPTCFYSFVCLEFFFFRVSFSLIVYLHRFVLFIFFLFTCTSYLCSNSPFIIIITFLFPHSILLVLIFFHRRTQHFICICPLISSLITTISLFSFPLFPSASYQPTSFYMFFSICIYSLFLLIYLSFFFLLPYFSTHFVIHSPAVLFFTIYVLIIFVHSL